jgi:DnaJ domain
VAENYYKILQISPDAQPEEIQRAYRSLARKYHPDLNSSPTASKLMAVINEAYEVLSDPTKREEYDSRLPKLWEKIDVPVMQAAKDILCRSGWNVNQESAWEFTLKHSTRREVYVVVTALLDAAAIRKCIYRSAGCSVLLAVHARPEVKVPAGMVAIDIMRSRRIAGEFPDTTYQDLFSAFLRLPRA